MNEQYERDCLTCKQKFMGKKRSTICKKCQAESRKRSLYGTLAERKLMKEVRRSLKNA